jgi:hypothetical protein
MCFPASIGWLPAFLAINRIKSTDTVRRQRNFQSILGETKSFKDQLIHFSYSSLGGLEIQPRTESVEGKST